MKKIIIYILLAVFAILILWLEYDKTVRIVPKYLYQVYLDDQIIGKINSKEKLEEYFSKEGENIKSQLERFEHDLKKENDIELVIELYNEKNDIEEIKNYIKTEHPNIDLEINKIINNSNNENIIQNLVKEKIDEKEKEYKTKYVESYSIYKYGTTFYIPNGVEIKKIATYNYDVLEVDDVYNQIQKLKTTSILGYRIAIKSDDKTEYLYAIDRKIFEDAIELTISTFIGKNSYELYINDNQIEIITTGTLIEKIYIDENITIKETKIPISEKIYTDAEELSQYLLFGNKENSSIYTVKIGDTIESVAINNKVNVEEIFMSNPEFTSVNNILSVGRQVVINELNPKISVVTVKKIVEDQVNGYKTDEIIDETLPIGRDEIIQEGINGLDRITIRIYSINGQEVNSETIKKEILKEPVNAKIKIGKKYISSIGSTISWRWPTVSGWHISTYWGYRTHPVYGYREFHRAIDISGPGLNSPIYAANNGNVITASWTQSYGNYILIDHNNGYFTLYAHMNYLAVTKDQTVSRGDVIGYMGKTGVATGVHLHFEVWYGAYWSGTSIDPFKLRYQ